MGRKTSVYLPDDLSEALASSGLSVAEVLRRGLGVGAYGEQVARLAARLAAEAVAADVRQAVRDEVRSALRDAREDSW